ncbi:alpha/beta hydrolase [Afipia sp. P52-10]|uniref:alpha/beta hydrolase n=1 Tax=Afipia sp. P52-10 TaxID=1429916 RepID=UPI0004ADD08C|nr:alpha/beta hydrolase [Afipia sp. P52-10]
MDPETVSDVVAGAKPSAAMREVVAIEARLREGHPIPDGMAAERALRAQICGYWIEGAPVPYQMTDVRIPGETGAVRARVYRPTATTAAPMLLLIHGGGWAFGSIEETEPLARHLAAQTGMVVVSTSYRLAPEHPFPAGLHDCEAALRWIKSEGRNYGGNPARLAISGASAGANLAAAVALRAPAATFAAQLLFYGVLGNDFDTPSYLHFGDGRFGLSRDRMQMFFNLYAPAGKTDDPAITPMNGNLAASPPAWICAAECDVLRDDSVQFYDKLRALRSGDQFVLAKGANHGFINRVRHLPVAQEMIDSATTFLKARLL